MVYSFRIFSYKFKKIVDINCRREPNRRCGDRTRGPREIIQERLIRACLYVTFVCICARVLCYYILSAVPDAEPSPCHWLLLVSYSGATVFLERATPAGVFRSRVRKKGRVERKRGEVEFLTGDASRK